MNFLFHVLFLSLLIKTSSAHKGWFPHIMGWYPDLVSTAETSQHIMKTWEPIKGKQCNVIAGRWIHLDEVDNPSTIVVEGNSVTQVSVQYVDESWLIQVPATGLLCIPPYKPILRIFVNQGEEATVWRLRSDPKNTETGKECPNIDFSKCVLPERSPRKLAKPTHEFFFTAAYKPAADELSVVTCGTVDRLLRIRQIAEAYQGPISAAIYLQTNITHELRELIAYYLKYPIMQKYVDIHLTVNDDINLIKTFDRPFPINFLRTSALKFARTLLVMYLEADFIPNLGMRNSPSLEHVRAKLSQDPKQIFIVYGLMTDAPALCNWDFDVEHNFIKDKEELSKWVSLNKEEIKEKVIPLSEIYTSHKPLNYAIWRDSTELYTIKDSGGFEPYYIGLRDYPIFDEIMVGCGRDKVIHFDELTTAGYKAQVIPDMFIIHLDSTYMGSAWCRNFGSDFPKDEAVRDRIDREWNNPNAYKSEPLVWWDSAQSRLEITSPYQSRGYQQSLPPPPPTPTYIPPNPNFGEDQLLAMTKEELVNQIRNIQVVLHKITSERETLREVSELQNWNLKSLMFFVFVVIGGIITFFWRRRKFVMWALFMGFVFQFVVFFLF